MPNEKSGKYALTRYIVQEEFPFLSVVRFKLETGRTHQIRAHCEYIHHPVFADEIYSGDDRQLKSIHLHYQKFAHGLFKYINRQALHAFRLEFIHPVKLEKMAFEVALPEDMQTVIEKCCNKFNQKE
jgi:23S rRNA pseudouridine1911/1915/1917 synthase